MKDELTDKMHSEFTVDAETDLKHKYWAALDCINDGMSVQDAIDIYDVTNEGLKKYLSEYNELFSERLSIE